MMLAVPYLRVSTDDKGQDPARQLDTIRPWAAREKIILLDAVIDEGTSASKTNPLERERFLYACELAKTAGAGAIVVECTDRFSRQGSKLDAWAEVELEKRFGLKLFRADKTAEAHGSMVAAVTDTIHAESARAWVTAHASKVRSGMARKKAAGAKFGRPSKPLTGPEIELVKRLRAEGKGWRRCAHAVLEARGVFKLADEERRKKASMSYQNVRRAIRAAESDK